MTQEEVTILQELYVTLMDDPEVQRPSPTRSRSASVEGELGLWESTGSALAALSPDVGEA